MEKSYIGKVTNGGAQKVKAPYPQKTQTNAKTQTGGDLRAKPSAKKG